jgi:hypothetical protein
MAPVPAVDSVPPLTVTPLICTVLPFSASMLPLAVWPMSLVSCSVPPLRASISAWLVKLPPLAGRTTCSV